MTARVADSPLIRLTDRGLYCEAGDFYVDPWRPVARAVLTHAHSDHAHVGNESYLVSRDGERLFRARLGDESHIESIAYGETRDIGGVRVSLHPAGHVLGSAQVRVEHRGEVWVVSGDYKTVPDPTCAPFEPLHCHTFITEATFGLPIYSWEPQSDVFAEVNRWWAKNRDAGRTSMILAYSLGKAQRVLAGVDPSIGPIVTHGAVERLTEEYRLTGVALPPTTYAGSLASREAARGALVVAPPSASDTPWAQRFDDPSTAFVSGWMLLRSGRKSRSVDRGFALSDHADWDELNRAIDATGADLVLVTHGSIAPLVRWLRERGRDARPLETFFRGEEGEAEEEESEP